ncbi:MAG: hypothetical protein ACM3SV_01495 [Betaproteobacteria bacterium]
MIPFEPHPMNPLQKALAALVAFALLGVGIMFSIVVIPIIVLMGAAGLGYFYWKTRALRKAMAEAARENVVIEGEAVIVHEPEEPPRRLPD